VTYASLQPLLLHLSQLLLGLLLLLLLLVRTTGFP
jgi:hypothetical protein